MRYPNRIIRFYLAAVASLLAFSATACSAPAQNINDAAKGTVALSTSKGYIDGALITWTAPTSSDDTAYGVIASAKPVKEVTKTATVYVEGGGDVLIDAQTFCKWLAEHPNGPTEAAKRLGSNNGNLDLEQATIAAYIVDMKDPKKPQTSCSK